MALPSQAIEKMLREPSHTQGAYRQLMMLSGSLFAIALLIWFGLEFGYKKYLADQSATLDASIAQYSKQITKDDQNHIISLYSQITNVKNLLNNHVIASPSLVLLESDAVPGLYFTKASLNAAQNEIILNGAAKTLDDVSLLAGVLEKDNQRVSRVNFDNAGVSNNLWQFSMTVFLNPNVLKGGLTPTQ